jgi:hypothetical protein
MSVPPLWVDGLTTALMPALNATAPVVVLELLLPLLALLPLLLLQALINSAAVAATAVAAKILRLFMSWKRLLYSFTSGLRTLGYRVLGSSASRNPSPNRLNASTVMKIVSPGTSMYSGSM